MLSELDLKHFVPILLVQSPHNILTMLRAAGVFKWCKTHTKKGFIMMAVM